MQAHLTRAELEQELDRTNALICRAQRRMLELIARANERALWRDSGARDMASYLSIRYGISHFKAARLLGAAHALRGLARICRALETGEIGLDKVLELCRIATPKTEAGLLRWAKGVSCGAIRHRAELQARRSRSEAAEADRARRLEWWFDPDGTRFGLQADLPAAEGAVVAGAIERLAAQIPQMPGEQGPVFAERRRADALVVLCSGQGSAGQSPATPAAGGEGTAAASMPTVVIHAPLEALSSPDRSCQIQLEHRFVLALAHAETLRRYACFGRLQLVAEDRHHNAVAMGRASRVPSAAMMRQLIWRDRECRFPGCGAKRFTVAHHIRWWSRGGRTDLDNLVLLCSFHHKLVHEYGWGLVREPDNTMRWFRPNGRRYRPGPPPRHALGPDEEELDPLGPYRLELPGSGPPPTPAGAAGLAPG